MVPGFIVCGGKKAARPLALPAADVDPAASMGPSLSSGACVIPVTPKFESVIIRKVRADTTCKYSDQKKIRCADQQTSEFVTAIGRAATAMEKLDPIFTDPIRRCIKYDQRVAKFSTFLIRERSKAVAGNISDNDVDHAFTTTFIFKTLLKGTAYIELPLAEDDQEARFVVIAELIENRGSTTKIRDRMQASKQWVCLSFGLDDGICFHCCVQHKHPRDVTDDSDKFKYLLTPINGVKLKLNNDQKHLDLVYPESKENLIKFLKSLKEDYYTNSDQFKSRYASIWEDGFSGDDNDDAV